MLSPLDMLVIGGAALIFFGPDQLPSVARKVGGVVRELQMTSQSFIREMERAADDAEAARRPVLDPVTPDPVAPDLVAPDSDMPELPLLDYRATEATANSDAAAVVKPQTDATAEAKPKEAR